MSDDPFRRYLDDFGHRLEEAAARSSRRRPSWRVALAGGVAIAAAAAVIALLLVAAPGGGGRLDVVAKARAALADRGRLVHFEARERVRVRPYSGRRVVGPRRFSFEIEQWATGNPPRWRIAYSFRGGYQMAFGHRAWSLYGERRNRLTIERGVRPKFAAGIPGPTSLLFGKAANDPIATIRGMLRRGELRDGGLASFDGHTVRRLVGKRPVFPGRSRPHVVVRYYVDPDSYTPVAARIGRPTTARAVAAAPAPARAYTDLRFRSFERLPLTAANARLLEIHPVGHPRITDIGANRARVVPVPPPAH
jgi:hypothetical protein